MRFISISIITLMFVSTGAFAQVGVVADVVLNPFGNFKAKSEKIKGKAKRKGALVTAENIIVDLNSLYTGLALRDSHAKEKYLETKKYPTATLIKAEGKDGKGTGVLKIRDIEKPISGTYTIKGSHLTAKFPLKLSDYGIKGISYKGVGVEDDINLEVTVPVE